MLLFFCVFFGSITAKKINKKKKKILDKIEGFVIHSFSLAAL